VAIDVESAPSSANPVGADPTEVPLVGDLFVPAEVPRDLVEEVVEAWPPARDSRSALERFGAALARFESDRQRVREALIECIVIPLIATTQSDDERAEGLQVAQRILGRSEEARSNLGDLERRLRARLS
jgi:hypothetical protein